MKIPKDFFDISFNKAMAFGYKTEEVDEFVTQAIDLIKAFAEENETLQHKLEIVAENLEKYKEEEDSLRSALIGAQKLGDSILREARKKAETIVKEATERAIVQEAEILDRKDRQLYEYERVKEESAAFKEELLALYKSHLDLIKRIPEEDFAPRHIVVQNRKEVSERPLTKEAPDSCEADTTSPTQPEEPQPENMGAENDEGIASAMFSEVEFTTENSEQTEIYEFVQEPEVHQNDEEADTDEENEDEINEIISDESIEIKSDFENTDKIDTVTEAAKIKVEISGNESTISFPKKESPRITYVDDGEDDEDFFSEPKEELLDHEPEMLQYFEEDDEDDDEFARQLASGKKPRLSSKFGILKFGDDYNLDDNY